MGADLGSECRSGGKQRFNLVNVLKFNYTPNKIPIY